MKWTLKYPEDKKFLNGLIKNDPLVLKEIYQSFFPGIAKHVKNNRGNREDAEDVFQDALIVVYRQIKKAPFELTSAFGTYLFGVAKRVWLKKRTRRNKKKERALKENVAEESTDFGGLLEKTERYCFFREKFRLLGEDCKKLLELFFNKVSMADIAQKMGYASEGYAKKRKFQCKKKLITLVQSDARFEEFRTPPNIKQ